MTTPTMTLHCVMMTPPSLCVREETSDGANATRKRIIRKKAEKFVIVDGEL